MKYEQPTFTVGPPSRVTACEKCVYGEKEHAAWCPERSKRLDSIMRSMDPEWRSRWCESEMCACMGCANRSGKLEEEGYSREEWDGWLKEQRAQGIEFACIPSGDPYPYTANARCQKCGARESSRGSRKFYAYTPQFTCRCALDDDGAKG